MTVEDVNLAGIPGKNRQVKLEQVYAWDNLVAAEKEARRGKSHKYGVRKFDRNREENLLKIQQMLMDGTYRTSKVKEEEQYCPCGKVRKLAKVPYCPDHIVHHALMRVIGPVITRSYYFDSAASIKGRGTEFSRRRVRRFIDQHKGSDIVFAKMDFTKFYQNIVQGLVYEELCRMFRDGGIRWLLREVVTAIGEGLGIGLFPIQPIANLHLNRLDRLVGEGKKGRIHLYRYCDDLLIVGFDTKEVWQAVETVRRYAADVLRQPLHTNVNVEHVTNRTGIDFVGFVFYRDYTLIRKRMKQRFRRKSRRLEQRIAAGDTQAVVLKQQVLASYKGWLMHCNGHNLWKKITGMKNFSELNIKKESVSKDGQKFYDVPTVSCGFLVGRSIVVKDFQEGVKTKNGDGRFVVLIMEGDHDCKFLTNNPRLKDVLTQCREQDAFPFRATLKSRALNGNKIDYYFE